MTVNTAFVPKINEPLVRQTMQAIADDLENWDQTKYVMRGPEGQVRRCFAGEALLIQGYVIDWCGEDDQRGVFAEVRGDDSCVRILNTMEEAMSEMGFTERQAANIFGWIPVDDRVSKEEQFQDFAEFVFVQTGIDCR